jgi:hypothetical protein
VSQDNELERIFRQRDIANAMSQTLLFATGRDYLATPDQLQKVYLPAAGRSPQLPPYFLQIDTIGQQLDSGHPASLSLQTALAACAGEQAHEVVFLVINDGRVNRVYLARPSQHMWMDRRLSADIMYSQAGLSYMKEGLASNGPARIL